MDSQPTIKELIQRGESKLVENDVPNARRNAEWMLCAALGCTVLDLYTSSVPPASVAAARYWRYILRRAAREPLQHILGTTEFMSLPFVVRPGVFVPRPDTEVLVEKAERWLRARPLDEPLNLLDLCCGSGVIGVSLAHRVPNIQLYVADINAEAVDATRHNAGLNGVGGRVQGWTLDAAEFLATVSDGAPQRFAAITCNPPYIESGEIAALPPEVRDHEPIAALDGGADGLDAYRALVPLLSGRLADGGLVIFEIGDAQAQAVSGMLRNEGFGDIEVLQDLAGRDRAVAALRFMER